MTCRQCGKSFHVPPSRMGQAKFCSSHCYHASTIGKPPHNKGKGTKKMLTDRGYVMVHMPDHPRANAWGYVREHIVVMEGVLGRLIPLGSGVVHHKNGIRDDNRPENLEFIDDHRAHLRMHFPKGQRVAIPAKRVKIVHDLTCTFCHAAFQSTQATRISCSKSCASRLAMRKRWHAT